MEKEGWNDDGNIRLMIIDYREVRSAALFCARNVVFLVFSLKNKEIFAYVNIFSYFCTQNCVRNKNMQEHHTI